MRRAADLSQQEFAALMDVPVNTFRMWDSGLRPTPLDAVQRARLAVTEHARNTQFLSLDQLARELGVHVRTLRAAARTGRLDVQLSLRSAFGRPIRLATRAAAAAFMERYYRQSYSRIARRPPPPDTHVPTDCADRIREVRRARSSRKRSWRKRSVQRTRPSSINGSLRSASPHQGSGSALRRWAVSRLACAVIRWHRWRLPAALVAFQSAPNEESVADR